MKNATLWALVERRAREAPDSPACLFGDQQVSNEAFRERAARLAGGLRALGIGRGDVVAVQLPNVPEYLVSYAALCALGAVMQTVHMPYRRAELSTLLAHSRAKAFICLSQFKDEKSAAQVRAMALPDLKHVIEHLPEGKFEAAEPCAADDRFLLLYTSGTTDNPKGVPLAYRGFLENARASVAELEVGPSDVLLSAAPLTHLYGLFVYHLALQSGAAMSLLPAFTPRDLAATIAQHRATGVFAGPAHFKPMLDAGLLDRTDLSSIKFVCLSGSAVPPALATLTGALDAAGIAKFKWPERVEAIAAMPLTPTQKIMRGRLKDLLKGSAK